MNENYDTNYLKPEHLQFPVSIIHICGYKNEENLGNGEGNPPTNHWAAFLELSSPGPDAKHTWVRLDMAPGYGPDGRRGKMQIASEENKFTNDVITSVSFGVRGHVTVEGIAQVINANGRDKYTFTEEFEGCRYWIYKVVQDMEAAGIVDAGSGESALSAVSHYWRNPSGSELRVVRQGTFY